MIYLLPVGCFPARVRGVGFGWCTACARVGGVLAPFAMAMPMAAVDCAFAAAAALAVALAAQCLQETRGRPLPARMAEDM